MMFDLFQLNFDFSTRQVIILILSIALVYLVSLMIPGIGPLVKHVSHTITKYIIHPISKYVFEAAIVWVIKTIWWLIKHVFFALKVYFYHLTTPRMRIFPELNKKQIGVINEDE